jgi:dCTP deaminase
MLVDWEIRRLLELDTVSIEPVLELDKQLNPSGIDLRLDAQLKEFRHMDQPAIDPHPQQIKREYELYEHKEIDVRRGREESYYVLQKGMFVIAQSLERISLPPFIAGALDGRSSLGRIGVVVHVTAGSIDPGFKGHVTFELANLGAMPVIIRPFDRVARLLLYLTKEVEKPYCGKYQHQTGVRPSRIFLD